MVAVILIFSGIVIRLIAIKQLRTDFKLELTQPNRIVTSGIFKFMRHPSYFGSLLIILGLTILKPVFGIMALSIWFFLSRIVNEEQILHNYPEYQKYKKKVGIFWPKRSKRNGDNS